MSTRNGTKATGVVERNIREHGFHLYLIQQSVVPRYAYTIGFAGRRLPELVLGGAIYYTADEVLKIMNVVGQTIVNTGRIESSYKISDFGEFTSRSVSRAWVPLLLLGAADFYRNETVEAVQLLPDVNHSTLDVPNLATLEPKAEPVWQWLSRDWPHHVPSTSTVVTNLQMLRGRRATEVMRCGNDEWELFAGAGPEVDQADMRVIPLGTALGIDPSLEAILGLEVGKGLWRDESDGEWNAWE